jgi:hypothetical protein
MSIFPTKILVATDGSEEAEPAANAKAWLQKAMIEGMEAVINGTDEVNVSVEVEARIARSWSEGG